MGHFLIHLDPTRSWNFKPKSENFLIVKSLEWYPLIQLKMADNVETKPTETPVAEETPKVVEETKEENGKNGDSENGHKNGDSENGHSKNGDSENGHSKNGDSENGHKAEENGKTETENGKEDTNGKEAETENGDADKEATKRKAEEDKPESIPVSAEKIAKLTETETPAEAEKPAEEATA